jgi:hypothetical protein
MTPETPAADRAAASGMYPSSSDGSIWLIAWSRNRVRERASARPIGTRVEPHVDEDAALRVGEVHLQRRRELGIVRLAHANELFHSAAERGGLERCSEEEDCDNAEITQGSTTTIEAHS